MKKRYCVILWSSLFLLLCAGVQAQSHGVEIGGKGGAAMWVGQGLTPQLGAYYGVEATYSCRWQVGEECFVGPKVGIGFGRAQGGMEKDNVYETFTNYEYIQWNDPHRMDYYVSAEAEQDFRQWQIEIPVGVSMKFNGVLVEAGAKLLYAMQGKTSQEIGDYSIRAHYTDFNVDILNEVITGVVPSDQMTRTGTEQLPNIHIAVSAAVGYEWRIKRNNYIGLAAYLDCGVWNNKTKSNRPYLISVAAISDPNNPPANVQVNWLNDAVATHYMDFGVKVYYMFEDTDYRYRNWHRR